MGLQEEIVRWSKEIVTDGYAMSIGELVNLYRDSELDLHPEFQRNYRWSLIQKSRLIESILIGIPLPSIFVSQREDIAHGGRPNITDSEYFQLHDGVLKLVQLFHRLLSDAAIVGTYKVS